MSFLSRLFGDKSDRRHLNPLYEAIVALGRDPLWYREGRVADTIDGRFDMIASILSLVLIRLEAEGEAARADSVRLTELFVDDMDGTLRQIGIGDVVVGKHLGKMMGALGGRLGAFRAALSGEDDVEEAVRRNIFRDAAPSQEALTLVSQRLERLHSALAATPVEPLRNGRLPSI